MMAKGLRREVVVVVLLFLFSCYVASDSLQHYGPQHRLLCPSLSPGICSNSCPLSQWSYLTISSFAIPFSFSLQSFPASRSFPKSWLFAPSGQGIQHHSFQWNQDRLPSGLIGLISLQFKGHSRVFSRTTVGKHQFFGAQPSLWSNSHLHTRLLEKP